MLAVQLFVCVKLFALVPVIEMLLIVNAAVPVFERITFWAALVVLTNWFANVTADAGETATTGAGAVPVPASDEV
jgi:hypothetical protein